MFHINRDILGEGRYHPIFQGHTQMLELPFYSFRFIFSIGYLQQFQYEAEIL